MYATLPDKFACETSIPVNVNRKGPERRSRSFRKVRAGQNLFREDDEAHHLFEVVSGVLRLSRVTPGGRRQVISFGLPGDVLGFPIDGRHHADCDVLEDGEVVVYPKRVLGNPSDDPELSLFLVRAAMQEIAGMQDHFMVLGGKCAIEKTATFLSVLATRAGRPTKAGVVITLPMYRSDIADFLGLSSETISRAFTCLKQDGVIELITAKEILIPDMNALVACAEAD